MALMTVRAAAEKLGVGYSTMKRWIGDGRVRTTLTEGGHHRIADAEIDRLTAHSQPAGKARSARAGDPDDTLAGLSARNRLAGFVEEVRIDGLLGPLLLATLPHTAASLESRNTVVLAPGEAGRELVDVLQLLLDSGLEVESVREVTPESPG